MWMNFLSSLNTPGGHIVCLALGVLLGTGLTMTGHDEGRTIMTASGGALLAVLRLNKE